MKKTQYIKYVWKEKTNAQTFNWIKIDVKEWDIFECSYKNGNNLNRMYPRLFKKVNESELVKEVEKKVEKKAIKKPLSKKSK